MDKIALIKAKIERLIAEYDKWIEEQGVRREELASLKEDFIDTLSEEPDKSLEEAAVDFVWDIMENDYYGPSELSKRLRPTSKLDDFYGALAEIFIAGAKWQAGQLLKGSPLPEDTVLFQKGVEEGRRLMMEDAVEGEVHKYDKFSYVKEKNSKSLTESLAKFNNNDKVKIIIVKEDSHE